MSGNAPVRLALPGSSTPTVAAVPTVRPILADMKAGGFEGVELAADGSILLVVKFPGHSAIKLSEDQIAAFCDRLTAEDPEVSEDPEKDPPDVVFARTASIDRAGNLTGRFSYKSKARELCVPANERDDLAALFANTLIAARTAVDEYNAKAAAETAKKNGSK